jgi:hypothetical protein
LTDIYAVLKDDDVCEAQGFSVKAYSPALAMCRKLVEAGYDPSSSLLAFRGDILALKVRQIGEGARMAVRDAPNGCPTFIRKPQEMLHAAFQVRVSENSDAGHGGA